MAKDPLIVLETANYVLLWKELQMGGGFMVLTLFRREKDPFGREYLGYMKDAADTGFLREMLLEYDFQRKQSR